MKTCSKCGGEKGEREFTRDRTKKDGLCTRCKDCVAAYKQEYQARNSEVLRAKDHDYYMKNKQAICAKSQIYRKSNLGKIRLKKKAYQLKNREKISARRIALLRSDPVVKAKKLLQSAKARAKHAKIPFDITINDILPFPEICPALGYRLKLSGAPHDYETASLDRVVPSRGYVASNVRVISDRANRLKRDATIEELEGILAYMKKHTHFHRRKSEMEFTRDELVAACRLWVEAHVEGECLSDEEIEDMPVEERAEACADALIYWLEQVRSGG